ncbi:MAG: hypothetical protein R2769_02945 [Saprospiraceae bacterium]
MQLEDEIFCSITRLNPDGTNMEVVQHGIRNTVGFDWHPVTGDSCGLPTMVAIDGR